MRVSLACTLEEIDALRADWESLERRTPEATGFQSFAWCRQWLACCDELGPGKVKPRIVTVHAGDRLVMLWPLQVVRWAGLRIARWIGEPMTQYGDILAEPGELRSEWQASAQAAVRSWRDVDLVLLKRVRGDSALGDVRFDSMISSNETAPFIDLADAGTTAIVDKQERRLRRRARRLAGVGELALHSALDSRSRSAAVRTALDFKREWLRQKGLFSRGLSHPVTARFLERLAHEGHLETSILTVGARVAAVELGVRNGSAYRSLLSAFDTRLAEGSPGHVLTSRLVTGAGERGIKVFDFLAPCDDYKTNWATGRTPLKGSAIVLTLRGNLGFFAVKLRPLIKRLVAIRLLGALRGRALLTVRPDRSQITLGRTDGAYS